MKRTPAFYLVAGGVGALVLLAVGVGVFIASGLYDIAARHPHTQVVRNTLKFLQERSVRYHSRDVAVPPLDDPQLVQDGLVLYRELCVVCHGAPGEARQRVGVGLNPNPPPLEQAAEIWSTAEIFWITAYGLKMAGMPAFALGKEPRDLWAIVAFMHRMNGLSPQEYRNMVAAVEGRPEAEPVVWLGETRMAAYPIRDADPERGRESIRALGCSTCHIVPGVTGADGVVGPPLTRWADRHYISGRILNTPENLIAWLVDPRALQPDTAMPDVGATTEQARDMAAYLYTLGRRPPWRNGEER